MAGEGNKARELVKGQTLDVQCEVGGVTLRVDGALEDGGRAIQSLALLAEAAGGPALLEVAYVGLPDRECEPKKVLYRVSGSFSLRVDGVEG